MKNNLSSGELSLPFSAWCHFLNYDDRTLDDPLVQLDRLLRERGAIATIAQQEEVSRCLAGLPRPIVLLHQGNVGGTDSSFLAPSVIMDLLCTLLDRMSGSLVLLESGGKLPKVPHARVRNVVDEWGTQTPGQTWWLLDAAALLIDLDASALGAATLQNTPTIAIMRQDHDPCVGDLPGPRTVNLVSSSMRDSLISRRRD